MQAEYVLPKIVCTWPNLVLLGTVRCSAHVRFAGVDLVEALLVSVQVVLGGETRLSVATEYVALVWFRMAILVLAVRTVSVTDHEGSSSFGHTCVQTYF